MWGGKKDSVGCFFHQWWFTFDLYVKLLVWRLCDWAASKMIKSRKKNVEKEENKSSMTLFCLVRENARIIVILWHKECESLFWCTSPQIQDCIGWEPLHCSHCVGLPTNCGEIVVWLSVFKVNLLSHTDVPRGTEIWHWLMLIALVVT